MGHTLTIRLQRPLAEWLEEEARRTGISQGALIRQQLDKARRSSRPRFMKLAGTVTGPTDLSTRKGFAKR